MFDNKIDNKTEMVAKKREAITKGILSSSRNPLVLFKSVNTFSIFS